jgi:hypothetical protein
MIDIKYTSVEKLGNDISHCLYVHGTRIREHDIISVKTKKEQVN